MWVVPFGLHFSEGFSFKDVSNPTGCGNMQGNMPDPPESRSLHTNPHFWETGVLTTSAGVLITMCLCLYSLLLHSNPCQTRVTKSNCHLSSRCVPCSTCNELTGLVQLLWAVCPHHFLPIVIHYIDASVGQSSKEME